MKTIAIVFGLVLVWVNPGCGQGTVNFSNVGRPIYEHCTGEPIPAGDRFMAALVFTTDFDYFVQLGASAGFVVPGTIVAGTRTAPVTPGTQGKFFIRVWETSTGDFYSASSRGQSAVVTLVTGNPTAVPPGLPGNLVASGLQSFSIGPITCVPEPSLVPLAIVGALGLGRWARK